MRVFIADDSLAVVERLADLLRDVPGVEYSGHAGDVSEALSSVRRLKPDALILDLRMAGGSGLDVLRAVRQDFPRLPVLICTNHSDAFSRKQCLLAGADYFLDKTMEFEKIPDILGGLELKSRETSAR
jgi:DNA-binding NarL/FixJ family response regulator